jgi:hypothetical protein
VFPVLAINMAVIGQERGWGLLNNFDFPHWLDLTIGIIDLALAPDSALHR